MSFKPLIFPMPWVSGTVGDAGEVLIPGTEDISVRCEGHDGLLGDVFTVRWGIDEAGSLPAYRSEPQTVPRDRYPLDFTIPVHEVLARDGEVAIDYEVARGGPVIDHSQPLRLRVIATPRLDPIDIVEANGDVIDLETFTTDATLSAPHQPETVPPGSTITFEWEGADGQGQPVRGTATGYDNGHEPTQRPLPRGDLERVADLAIRYKVDTGTATRRAGRPLAAFESAWRTFHLSGGTAAWPELAILELTGDTLVPPAVSRGATCVIDADLVATDIVMVTFGDYTSPPHPGSRPLRIMVPPGEIGQRLNQAVRVGYTVERHGFRTHASAITVHVAGFSANDPQLPLPRIDAADGEVVDLGSFTDTPHALVDPWLLMDPRQRVWLVLTGENQDGSPAELTLLNGAHVEPHWLETGIEQDIDRDVLTLWRNRSTLRLHCHVNFSGGDLAEAIAFRARSYTLLTGTSGATGRAWEAENFDGLVTLIHQRDVQMRFLRLRQIRGNLYVAPGETPPYVDGPSSPHWIQAGAHSELTLDRPAPYVRIGVSPQATGIPIHVAAYDDMDERLSLVAHELPGWVHLREGPANRRIKRVELWTTGDGIAWFDNVLVETGEPWTMVREPVLERFDELAPGRFGERLDIPGWTFGADRADLEIEKAPPGMVGQALAFHMGPEGRVHFMTPRFGIRPVQSVQFLLRGSQADPHWARVHLVYFNLDDHVVRTAATREIEVQAATQLVTFDRPAELPRQNELLSHILIVHEDNGRETTAFYDDISIV
jgi:hypothetical protein